ncbi:MAG TPA: S49 family peptidase, partial [Fluviicola sp.]|nr:S49 family peptidase [Fluviicola sp.]
MSTTKISFWRIFWPSVVASISLSILGWIFWIFVLGALTPTPTVKDMHVLHMSLHGPIGERSETSINPTSFKQDEKIGLSDILFGLKQAKDDNSVDGIYLEIGAIQCGYATAMEIRNALIDFKKSGKFLIAYLQGEVVTQKQYYISTAAEKIYGFETSSMEFLGLGGELMFFKNTLDELGIEMQ